METSLEKLHSHLIFFEYQLVSAWSKYIYEAIEDDIFSNTMLLYKASYRNRLLEIFKDKINLEQFPYNTELGKNFDIFKLRFLIIKLLSWL